MAVGLHRCSFSIATRPQPSHTYFMAASLSLHICFGLVSGAPQKLHLDLSPQGLHKCPGSLATAPQFLHVYAIAPSFRLYKQADYYHQYGDDTIKVKPILSASLHCRSIRVICKGNMPLYTNIGSTSSVNHFHRSQYILLPADFMGARCSSSTC